MTNSEQHRNSGIVRLARVAGLFILLVTATAAQAQTLQVLHTFTGGGDGWGPYAGLNMDRAGNLYGTTFAGGTYESGTVFRLSRAGSGWILSSLYSFHGGTESSFPLARVVFGPDGTLYGTTEGNAEGYRGDYGSVFHLTPPATPCKTVLCPWTKTTLYRFMGSSDGAAPAFGDLTFDQAGNIYGTTAGGGTYYRGVVFKLTPSTGGWIETVLWNFTGGSDGGIPENGVIFDSAGNLYGTTSNYQGSGAGGVYELSPSGSGWTEKTLYTLDLTGNTLGGVSMDEHGNLFGATGGPNGPGGAWELTPSDGTWTFNLLQTFSGSEGPWDTPTLDAGGNVYGSSSFTGSSGQGEVFKLAPSNGGWIYTSFGFDGSDGAGPTGSVILDAEGNIYGTTTVGYGEVWEVTP